MPSASVYDINLMQNIERLYANNLSLTLIAEKYGLTKNQVVGLIQTARRHGYNFPARDNSKVKKKKSSIQKLKEKEARQKSDKVKAAGIGPVKHEPAIKDIAQLYPVAVAPSVVPKEGLPLLELVTNACRYSIGENSDGLFLFCARRQKQGSAYCEKHHKAVYTIHHLRRRY